MVSFGGATFGTAVSLIGVVSTVGVPVAGCTSILASIVKLITNDLLLKLKMRDKKLKDCINRINVLYEKVLKKSLLDKKTDKGEGEELRKIFIHHLDKCESLMKRPMKSLERSYHQIFGDFLEKKALTVKK